MQRRAVTDRVEVERNEARLVHGELVERYFHGPLGLEQRFEIGERPEGEGALVVEMRLGGLRAEQDGTLAADLVGSRGRVVRYSEIWAEDTDGRALPTRLEANGDRLRLVVDDQTARYPIVVDPLVGLEQARLTASDGSPGDMFSYSVSLSGAGDRALVGAPLDDNRRGADAGSAYLFVRSGTRWTLEVRLDAGDGATNDRFGTSVSLSATGDHALIGAPLADTGRGGTDAGAAYVFGRSGSGWTQEAKLEADDGVGADEFGQSVSLSAMADRAIVGAPRDDTLRGLRAGSAYVFARTGTTWSREAKLVAGDGTAGATFGSSVSLSSSGDRVLIGAPRDGLVEQGSAYVFVRVDTSWGNEAKLLASDGANYDRFGSHVSLSNAGDRALIGTPDDDTSRGMDAGSAYVFLRSGTTWAREAKLEVSDGAAHQRVGCSVAFSGTADLALVGTCGTDPNAAYVFARSGLLWAPAIRLRASDRAGAGVFGRSVSLSAAGDHALVGAFSPDAAYVFVIGKANGDSCRASTECASGFCVDGVCCNSACGEGSTTDCVACSASAGAAVNGTCGPLSAAVAPTVICRPSTGPCDRAETCSPGVASCPADRLEAAGVVCRPAAGECDMAETCDGTSATCPEDVTRPDGAPCTDGMVCNGRETCRRGTCVAAMAVDCDDGDVCTADSCVEPMGCRHDPLVGCCRSHSECDDGDACTVDACESNACTHTPAEGCGGVDDAGMGTDSGMSASDGGGTDRDGGSVMDLDGGTNEDGGGGGVRDAGGGVDLDGGTNEDGGGGGVRDAGGGVDRDAGTSGTGDGGILTHASGGCGCRVALPATSRNTPLAFVALALLAFARRFRSGRGARSAEPGAGVKVRARSVRTLPPEERAGTLEGARDIRGHRYISPDHGRA
jgi:hypothetical protein